MFRAPILVNIRHGHHQPADNPPNLALGLLRFTPPTLPLFSFDPDCQPRPVRRVQDVNVYDTNPLLFSPVAQTSPQLPLFVAVNECQPRPVRRAQSENYPNLTLGLLSFTPPVPPLFVPVPDCQPRPVRRAQDVNAYDTNPLLFSPVPPSTPDLPLFVPVNECQPRPVRRAQDINAYGTNTLLLSDSTLPLAPVPANDIRNRRRLIADDIPNLLISTLGLGVVQSPPFLSILHEQPRSVRRAQSENYQNTLVALFQLPPPPPQIQAWDFSDQVRRVRRVQDTPQANVLPTLFRVDPMPSRQLWWDVPRAPRRQPDSWFGGFNALIPNVRPPYIAPPDEQPGAIYFTVRLDAGLFHVALAAPVFPVRAVAHTMGGDLHGTGLMTSKTEDYAADDFTKSPGSSRQVVLNLYDLCCNFRLPNEPVDLGEFVRPRNGNGFAYEVTVAGTTADREPVYPTEEGSVVVDGSAEFTCRLPALLGISALSSPSAVSDPLGLTITNVAAVEGFKLVATYSGGTLGRDYTAVFTVTVNGRPLEFRQLVKIRRQ